MSNLNKIRAFSWRSLSFFFAGTAGDSFYFNRGVSFSTKDSDNDNWGNNCASFAKGAWWYRTCTLYSSLNGLYLPGKSDYRGICWYYGKKTCVSFKGSEMKIRPKGFLPS